MTKFVISSELHDIMEGLKELVDETDNVENKIAIYEGMRKVVETAVNAKKASAVKPVIALPKLGKEVQRALDARNATDAEEMGDGKTGKVH